MNKSRLIPLQSSAFDLMAALKKQPNDITTGMPAQRTQCAYENTENGAKAGVWDSSSGSWNVIISGYTEFCVVLEGQAVVRDRAGNENVFNAGDGLIMEDGFKGVWHVPNYIKKYFFIVNTQG